MTASLEPSRRRFKGRPVPHGSAIEIMDWNDEDDNPELLASELSDFCLRFKVRKHVCDPRVGIIALTQTTSASPMFP